MPLSLDTRRLERFEPSEHRHYGEPWRGAEGFSLQLTRSQRLLGGDLRPFRREGRWKVPELLAVDSAGWGILGP